MPLGGLRCGCTRGAGDSKFCVDDRSQFNNFAAGFVDMYLYCVCRTDGLMPLRDCRTNINNAAIPTVVKLYVKDIITGMFEFRNTDAVTQINEGTGGNSL